MNDWNLMTSAAYNAFGLDFQMNWIFASNEFMEKWN